MGSFLKAIREKIDNNPRLKPYLLMWLRKTTKTINKWPQEKFIRGVMDCYERHCGYRFDLNNPVLFNEKLQWYKCFYQRDDFANITDKVLFKDYIKSNLGDGFTIPLYGSWTSVKDFEMDWEKLPLNFVLKSNLSSDTRGVIVVKNKNEVSLKNIKTIVKGWLKPWNTLLNSWDYRFYNSTPKILAEKFMQDEYGELRDYKFFCFDGFVPYFCVDYGRMDNRHHRVFFNAKKEKTDLSVSSFSLEENKAIGLPQNIDEMFDIAKKISVGFPFIRVDFFSCNNQLYISELTFAPGGGVTPYPIDFQKELGSYFKLPL